MVSILGWKHEGIFASLYFTICSNKAELLQPYHHLKQFIFSCSWNCRMKKVLILNMRITV